MILFMAGIGAGIILAAMILLVTDRIKRANNETWTASSDNSVRITLNLKEEMQKLLIRIT